jgi:predicted dehydrogenase
LSRVLGRVYSARFNVGQYLPNWRPSIDYRNNYSAKKELGGGVVFDLIHEIDIAINLFGEVKNKFFSINERLSDLVINTEDIAEILYKSQQDVIVSIHLDYLNQNNTRTIEITAEKGSIYVDLITSKIKIMSKSLKLGSQHPTNPINFERNQMYIDMLAYYIRCINKCSEPNPSILSAIYTTEVTLKINN